MNRITEYNQSINFDNPCKSQFSFKLDLSSKHKARKEFNAQVMEAIAGFHISAKQPCEVASLPQDEFDGIRVSAENLKLEYFTDVLVGFPYRIGFITYRVENTEFWKLGIKLNYHKS